MLFTKTQEVTQIIGGVDIFSPLGFIILTFGVLFTVGVPLTMILKGRKD